MLNMAPVAHGRVPVSTLLTSPARVGSAPTHVRPFQGLKATGCLPKILRPQLPVNLLLQRLVTAATAQSRPQSGLKQATTGHNGQKLNIVFVSAEVAPWSKTGGLGDVVGGLPIELAKRGHSVYSVAPRYDQYNDAWDTSVTVDIDGETVRYFHTRKAGVDRIWVDHHLFLAKVWGQTGSKLYGEKSGSDFADNQKRFLMFNKAAIEALRVLPFSPGEETIIVCNDWHTAILPVLIKEVYQPSGQFTKTKVALCLHNIAFQGRFWAESWPELRLPDSARRLFDFEDGYDRVFDETEPLPEDESQLLSAGELGQRYKKINWLKAGFLTADKLLTVSPNYATEVMTDPQKGVELDHVIREVGGIEGIVNGMDTNDWSPTNDKFLDVKYDSDTVEEGKAIAKQTLQAELGLPVDPSVPLFGFIGRLEEQKGVDILLNALPAIVNGGKKVQVAILGTGKKSFEKVVAGLEQQYPDRVKGVVKFSAPLAHFITAGADFMLVPSRFEPCGLIQLHAMQYGTVPLVASTGGLVDTVKEGVTGFHMGAFDPDDLLQADSDSLAHTVQRAAEVFPTPRFKEMRDKCIRQELSWALPAKKWEATLQEVVQGHTVRRPIPAPPAAAPARPSIVPTPVENINNPATNKPKVGGPPPAGSAYNGAGFSPGTAAALKGVSKLSGAATAAAPTTSGSPAGPRAKSVKPEKKPAQPSSTEANPALGKPPGGPAIKPPTQNGAASAPSKVSSNA